MTDETAALVAAQRRHDAWIDRHRSELARWSALDRQLQLREYRLGQAAAYTRPEHLASLLGPLPERVSEVERWQSAAGTIEIYRARWNVTSPEPLGPVPADPEQRTHWYRALAALGSAGFGLSEGLKSSPNAMSLASMWTRVGNLESSRPDLELNVVRAPDGLSPAWDRADEQNTFLDEHLGL